MPPELSTRRHEAVRYAQIGAGYLLLATALCALVIAVTAVPVFALAFLPLGAAALVMLGLSERP